MDKNFFKINKTFTTSGIVLFLILSLLSPGSVTFSQELQSVDDTVQKLQLFYEQTKDLKADFVQEVTIKAAKKTQREEGRVYFKNPKNMIWEYRKPKGKKLVVNSQTSWLYLAEEKVVYTQNSERIFQSKLLLNFFSGKGKLNDDFTIKYAQPNSLDKEGNYILILIPKTKVKNLTSVKMTVDKDNYYILQLSFDDLLGNHTQLNFSNVSVNIGLEQKIFQFKPPAGTDVFEVP